MILVDTSVWIDHLRGRESALAVELNAGRVLMHPFVLGELACGNLRNRPRVLYLLQRLPRATVATDAEALTYIEHNRLMGHGIGYVDVHLLASVSLGEPARLWTRDTRLAAIAADLGLAFEKA
jgi:predicted nucleic acid-binding protein